MERFRIKEKFSNYVSSHVSLVLVVSVVIFGTSFGVYNTAVVNNLYPTVVEYLNVTNAGIKVNSNPDTVWSIVVVAYPIGVGFGTLCSVILAEKLGRKLGLIIAAAFNICGGLMCVFYLNVFELAIGGRLFMGASLGTGLPLASSFITEISPVQYRGACNAALQAGFSFGDVMGMILSLSNVLGTLSLSKFALGFTAVTSTSMFCVLLFAYETPRYLILKRNKLELGKKAIIFYQGRQKSDEVFDEIVAESRVRISSDNEKTNLCKFLLSLPKKPLLIVCGCFIIPVLSGIAIIMGYSTDALNNNRQPPAITPYFSLLLATCNFISSLSSIRLVERWGRKTLVLMGLIGSFVGPLMYTVLALVNNYATVPYWFCYTLVVALCIYALFYSFLNASCITLAAEVCSQSYRSYAMAVGNFCQMLGSTIVIMSYEPIKHALGVSWVYFPFNCFSFVVGILMFFVLPETSGVTLTDIKKQFMTTTRK